MRACRDGSQGSPAAPASARAEISALARDQGVAINSVDLETLVEQAPTSSAARDRLAVLAVGLGEPAAELDRLLKPLGSALRAIGKAMAGELKEAA